MEEVESRMGVGLLGACLRPSSIVPVSKRCMQFSRWICIAWDGIRNRIVAFLLRLVVWTAQFIGHSLIGLSRICFWWFGFRRFVSK